MNISQIRSALVKAFTDGAFFAPDKVAWENVAFTPPTAAAWSAVHFLPSQPDVATLGTGGLDEVNGLIQIDLNYPTGKGTKDVDDKADAIRSLFTAGARFAYSDVEVVIRSAGRSPGAVVNGFWRVSVSVFFYSHITR